MRTALALLLSLAAVVAPGCCPQRPCPEVKPGPCYLCTDSPDVAAVRTCLDGCGTPECRSGCCHRLAMVPGSDAERAALRSCLRECAAP